MLIDLRAFLCMRQHDIDGKAYYTFEFMVKAPNYTRHALSTVSIGNGMELIFDVWICHKHDTETLFISLPSSGGMELWPCAAPLIAAVSCLII